MAKKTRILLRPPGQKRVIEKFISYDNETISNSQVNTTLYTATDNVTLVRIVGHVSYRLHTNGGNLPTVIHFKRETDAAIALSATGDTMDGGEAERILWGANETLKTTADETITKPVDVKGMRKLRKDDTIVISVLGPAADAGYLNWFLTFFFKKT